MGKDCKKHPCQGDGAPTVLVILFCIITAICIFLHYHGR